MSNNKKVTADSFSSAVMNYLQDYKEDIFEDVKELADKYSKEAQRELRDISPKAKKKVYLKKSLLCDSNFVEPGSYAKSWTLKNGKKATDIYSKIVINKEHYRLTHLLEFGHALRNGKRFTGIPHIRKTEDKYKELFEKELEQKIRRKT